MERGANEGGLDDIIDELAAVLWQAEPARLLVLRAGFPPQHIPEFKTPEAFWTLIMRAAMDGKLAGGVQALLDQAARQFPSNPRLANRDRSACPLGRPGHPFTATARGRSVVSRLRAVGATGATLAVVCAGCWAMYDSRHATEPVSTRLASPPAPSSVYEDAVLPAADPPAADLDLPAESSASCPDGFELRMDVNRTKPDGTPWDADLSAPDLVGAVQLTIGDETHKERLSRRERFNVTAPFFKGRSIPYDALIRSTIVDADLYDNDAITTFSGVRLGDLIRAQHRRRGVKLHASCL